VDALFLVFMIFIISLFSMVIFLWLAIISLICLLFFCFLWFRFIMFLVLSIHLSSHFLLISSSLSQMNPSIELYPFLFRSGEKFLFLVHFFRVILLYCLWCCFLVPTYLSSSTLTYLITPSFRTPMQLLSTSRPTGRSTYIYERARWDEYVLW